MSPFSVSLLAGAFAGTSVDLALYPLDTIKTRIQSAQGFIKAGGFKGVYNGLQSAAVGSAPGAAAFFVTYDSMKRIWSDGKHLGGSHPPQGSGNAQVVHMAAASVGEVVACLFRVPTDNVKQKIQAGQYQSTWNAFKAVYSSRGLYTGYGITLLREIPFSLIQFPLYEELKTRWGTFRRQDVSPVQAATCGSFAGAIAAALTTPIDVVKTRLMLGKGATGHAYTGVSDVVREVVRDKALFRGVAPRVTWISIGGFVFFGAFEVAKGKLLNI